MIFPYIFLYRFILPLEVRAPFSHKSQKMIAALSVLISEKVHVYKGFFPLMLIDTTKSNTIFYIYTSNYHKNISFTIHNLFFSIIHLFANVHIYKFQPYFVQVEFSNFLAFPQNVPTGIPQASAACRSVIFFFLQFRCISRKLSGEGSAGRPNLTPFAFAAAIPCLTLPDVHPLILRHKRQHLQHNVNPLLFHEDPPPFQYFPIIAPQPVYALDVEQVILFPPPHHPLVSRTVKILA